MDKKHSSSWFAWTFSNAPVLGVLILIVFTLLIVILSLQYSLNSELVSLEEKLRYTPPQTSPAAPGGETVDAQAHQVYVPAYSHIYHSGGTPALLAVTLSVRNTDPKGELRVSSVRYYDTQGNFIKEYLNAPAVLKALSTAEFLVEQQNVEGGSGANFIVEWSGRAEINPPIIESVMIGSQGISFVGAGREIRSATR
jgi:hypothetical protein